LIFLDLEKIIATAFLQHFQQPDQKTIDTINHAASLLSGAERRAFQAQTVLDHCNGNWSQAKTLFGWHQDTVQRPAAKLRKPEKSVQNAQACCFLPNGEDCGASIKMLHFLKLTHRCAISWCVSLAGRCIEKMHYNP